MANLSVDGKIINNHDQYTGEPFNSVVTTTWYDGSTMNDSKVDNIIYFKNLSSLGGGYSRRSYTGRANIKWFGAIEGMDSTAALNKALNMPYPLDVAIPEGNWLIRNSISPGSNKSISGSGFGTRIYTDLISTDPKYGFNFFEVVNQQNVTISNMYINGTYNAGTSFPPTGVISGQGVTIAFVGCKNVRALNCFLDRNGRGSGSIYFSKCIDGFAIGNTIEKSTNGICADNYYGPSNTFGGAYCNNIVISNNIITDVAGRGITCDCMESAAINSNITIQGNQVNAAAFAGIQINARGALVVDNVIDGKRDDSHSTVGGQQSFPTLYGIYVDIGCEDIDIRSNRVSNVKEHCIKTQYAKNLVFESNTVSLATAYKDQTIGFQTVLLNDAGNIPIFFNWVDNLRGNPENITVRNNTVYNQRLGGVSNIYSTIISFNDSSGDTTMADNTNFIVSGNTLDCATMNIGISFFHSATGKRGDFTITDNKLFGGDPTTSKFGVSGGSLDNYNLFNNKFNKIGTPVAVGRANSFTSTGNIIKNYVNAYQFSLSNVNAEIDNMVMSDYIVGPTAGFIFTATNPNPYVVTNSDGSGMKFIGIGTATVIRNSYYPAKIIANVGYSTVPTTGMWTQGDTVINNAYPVTDNTFVKEWYRRTTSTNNVSNNNNATTNANFTTDWIPNSVNVNGMSTRKYQTSNRDILPYASGFNNQGSTFETLASTPGLPAAEPFLTGINLLSNSNAAFWTQLAKGTGDNLWIRSWDSVNNVWGQDKRIFNQYLPVRLAITTGLITSSDYTILCDTNGATGTFTQTLPSTAIAGLTFVIKKIDNGTAPITIAGIIDGVTNYLLLSQNDSVVVQSTGNGTEYRIISKSNTSSSTTPSNQGFQI